jgi:hypothetical protein
MAPPAIFSRQFSDWPSFRMGMEDGGPEEAIYGYQTSALLSSTRAVGN